MKALSVDASSREEASQEVEALGPSGSITPMIAVLRAPSFTKLTKQHFNYVYRPKAATLNTILDLIDLTGVIFNLLFPTIGTAFRSQTTP